MGFRMQKSIAINAAIPEFPRRSWGCTAAALNSIQHSTVSASTYTRRGVLSHGESPGTVWGPPRLQHHPRRPSSLTRRVLPPSWRRRPTRCVVLPRRGSPGAARRPSPASAASTY
ncbi:hypothetical protein PVAP13_6KG300706 [Panicum virgatum]|uniref:Uncharacterized protein n=1 Tax=Panicum virgatum TaxID=38727 RepID=A0A8T0REK7_PANVG|nr:hypothetical protein PVAP13_6KG300706 [Panicum virgatum]